MLAEKTHWLKALTFQFYFVCDISDFQGKNYTFQPVEKWHLSTRVAATPATRCSVPDSFIHLTWTAWGSKCGMHSRGLKIWSTVYCGWINMGGKGGATMCLNSLYRRHYSTVLYQTLDKRPPSEAADIKRNSVSGRVHLSLFLTHSLCDPEPGSMSGCHGNFFFFFHFFPKASYIILVWNISAQQCCGPRRSTG